MRIAPIALFVYNRVSQTQRTVAALQKNTMAAESDLFVFSDGPKVGEPGNAVAEVRQYIRGIDGFGTVTIIGQDSNRGLALSIIDGVTRLCNEYGRVIVVEDDLVTSPQFLKFMNTALEHYAEEKRVWHISGWNYPVDTNDLPETFLYRTMNCWGWATWADRWQHYRKDPERLMRQWDEEKIDRFNLDGANDFWEQVIRNYQGTMTTWAIFWYATIFEHDGLCLNPATTYVRNIGHDGSGVHCSDVDIYSAPLAKDMIRKFPETIKEDAEAVNSIRQFYTSGRLGFLEWLKNDLRHYKRSFRAFIHGKKSSQR